MGLPVGIYNTSPLTRPIMIRVNQHIKKQFVWSPYQSRFLLTTVTNRGCIVCYNSCNISIYKTLHLLHFSFLVQRITLQFSKKRILLTTVLIRKHQLKITKLFLDISGFKKIVKDILRNVRNYINAPTYGFKSLLVIYYEVYGG